MTQPVQPSTLPWPPEQALFWLPDDTEESIVGTNLHQLVGDHASPAAAR